METSTAPEPRGVTTTPSGVHYVVAGASVGRLTLWVRIHADGTERLVEIPQAQIDTIDASTRIIHTRDRLVRKYHWTSPVEDPHIANTWEVAPAWEPVAGQEDGAFIDARDTPPLVT